MALATAVALREGAVELELATAVLMVDAEAAGFWQMLRARLCTL